MPEFLSIKSFSIYFVFGGSTGYGGHKFPDLSSKERLVFCRYDTYFPVTVRIFMQYQLPFSVWKSRLLIAKKLGLLN